MVQYVYILVFREALTVFFRAWFSLLQSPIGGSYIKRMFVNMSKNHSLHKLLVYFSSPLTQSGEGAVIDYLRDSETLRLLR